MSFKEAMEMIDTDILSLYREKAPLHDLRPSSSISSIEAAQGELMTMASSPMFTRHANPMDTELEINLMNELTTAFNLPESFKFENGGLGIINNDEMDSILSLFYAAKFDALRKGEKVEANLYSIYLPHCRYSEDFIEKMRLITDALIIVYKSHELDETVRMNKTQGILPLFLIQDISSMEEKKFKVESE
jgi:hypothetical protein